MSSTVTCEATEIDEKTTFDICMIKDGKETRYTFEPVVPHWKYIIAYSSLNSYREYVSDDFDSFSDAYESYSNFYPKEEFGWYITLLNERLIYVDQQGREHITRLNDGVIEETVGEDRLAHFGLSSEEYNNLLEEIILRHDEHNAGRYLYQ